MKIPTINWKEAPPVHDADVKELSYLLSNSIAVMYAVIHWQEDIIRKINLAYEKEKE